MLEKILTPFYVRKKILLHQRFGKNKILTQTKQPIITPPPSKVTWSALI